MDHAFKVRAYWAANPDMLFSHPELGEIKILTIDSEFESFRPHLKNVGSMSDEEIHELLHLLFGNNYEVVEVMKSREHRAGFVTIGLTRDESQHSEFKYNLWLDGNGRHEFWDETEDERNPKSCELQWNIVINYLRSKGYNTDFSQSEYIDITPPVKAY